MRAIDYLREAQKGGDQIITWVDGKKGLHYRPHRSDPANFVVVKIYHSIKGSRKILQAFLNTLGGKFTVKKGKYKWVAIAPREKVEQKAKEMAKKTQGQATKAATTTKVKTKAKEKQAQTQEQPEKQYQLGKGYVGKYSLGYAGQGQQAQQKQYQRVYTLAMSRDLDNVRAMMTEVFGGPSLGKGSSYRMAPAGQKQPSRSHMKAKGIKYRGYVALTYNLDRNPAYLKKHPDFERNSEEVLRHVAQYISFNPDKIYNKVTARFVKGNLELMFTVKDKNLADDVIDNTIDTITGIAEDGLYHAVRTSAELQWLFGGTEDMIDFEPKVEIS